MSEESKETKRLLVILISATAATEQAPSPMPVPYVLGEIVVKFRKPVSDGLQSQLRQGKHQADLRLSQRLDKLNRDHKAKRIKPVGIFERIASVWSISVCVKCRHLATGRDICSEDSIARRKLPEFLNSTESTRSILMQISTSQFSRS